MQLFLPWSLEERTRRVVSNEYGPPLFQINDMGKREGMCIENMVYGMACMDACVRRRHVYQIDTYDLSKKCYIDDNDNDR